MITKVSYLNWRCSEIVHSPIIADSKLAGQQTEKDH